MPEIFHKQNLGFLFKIHVHDNSNLSGEGWGEDAREIYVRN